MYPPFPLRFFWQSDFPLRGQGVLPFQRKNPLSSILRLPLSISMLLCILCQRKQRPGPFHTSLIDFPSMETNNIKATPFNQNQNSTKYVFVGYQKFSVFDYFGEMEDYNVFFMGLCASNILSPNKSLTFKTFCLSKSPPL